MGGEFEDDEKVVEEWVRDTAIAGALPEGTTLETMRQKGVMRFTSIGHSPAMLSQACDLKEDETFCPLRWHVENKLPYPTLTQRAQFYIDHEWFLEADEQLPRHKENPKMGGDYPLVLTTGHNRWSIHAANIINRTMQETNQGRPFMFMNVNDAAQRSIRLRKHTHDAIADRVPRRQRDRQPAGDGRSPGQRARGVGQDLGDLAGELVHDAPHERAQRALPEPLGERVDGHEAARVQALVLAALDDLPVRLLEHDRAPVARDPAVEDEALAALERAGQVAPAEPARRGVAARVPQHDREGLARAPGRRRREADDRARAGRRLARLERAERREPRAVLVAQRQEEQGVLDGAQALLL